MIPQEGPLGLGEGGQFMTEDTTHTHTHAPNVKQLTLAKKKHAHT